MSAIVTGVVAGGLMAFAVRRDSPFLGWLSIMVSFASGLYLARFL